MSYKKITTDEFKSQYKPVPNHLNTKAPFDGWLFNTYGPDFEHIQAVATTTPARVWTVLDHDGELAITNGIQYVNRIGFIVTEKPVEAGIHFVEASDA